jgi:tight adherence protein B
MTFLNVLLSALLIGAGVGLLVYAQRGMLLRRYHRDCDYVAETSARFSPEPINAGRITIRIYIAYGVLLVILLATLGNPLLSILLWIGMLFVPKMLIGYLWQKRRKQIDEQLAPTVSNMCNSMRAGLTLVQAIQRLAENAPDPIRTEFRIMANRYAHGSDLETTIIESKNRLKLPNFNLFASAILLNREMGGNISETLNRISISLDKLKQMRATVAAHTSEGRTNIKVLLLAPWFMLAIIATVNPEGVKLMFTTPQGYVILLGAVILGGLGTFLGMRITRSRV